ncbi:MAG TPA: CBS domain-containing protein [Gemmatimonadales bacterium]|nr:CBS domain-containing protein [Gemmatimonadales bacterium]
MATVRELLARKTGGLLAVPPGTTVLEASEQMNDRGTGSVLVTDGGKLVGIFTERDLMRRVVAAHRNAATTPLAEVMTTALVTCTPDATASDCGALMSERRIRHLPVVEGDNIHGVITTGDLLAHELREKEATIQQLEAFVFYVRQ